LGPMKAAIGWVRFVAQGERDNAPIKLYLVEKMSYEDHEIDNNPDVIINATSEPCGIELTCDDALKEWTVTVGGAFHSKHVDRPIDILKSGKWNMRSAWSLARQAVIDMSVLDWMAML